MPCFSLEIKGENQSIFFTADSRFTPDYHHPYFSAADFIFHDCETSEYQSGVHAHYTDLVTLPEAIKSKMYLYHYAEKKPIDPKADGFLGYVEAGDIFPIG